MHRPRIPQLAVAATAVVATVGLGAGTAVAAGTTPSPAPSTPGTAPAHQHQHKAKGGHGDHNVPLPANATLQQVQAAAKTDIANRVTDLQKAAARVQKAKFLGGDQAAMVTSINGQVQGLQALGTKIAGDTDLATAKADYMDIFTQYRVYALEIPRDRLVAADDAVTGRAQPALSKVETRLKTREAKATPAVQAQVTPLLGDITTQVTNASGAVKGQSATLLAVTPAQWNANHDVLKAFVTPAKTARGDIKKAVTDAKQAKSDLGVRDHHKKGTKGATTPAPATPGTAGSPAPSTSA